MIVVRQDWVLVVSVKIHVLFSKWLFWNEGVCIVLFISRYPQLMLSSGTNNRSELIFTMDFMELKESLTCLPITRLYRGCPISGCQGQITF